MIQHLILGREKRFLFLKNIQTGSGAHTASYSTGTRGSSPMGKASGARTWPLSSIYC
jgi:hypothetical protein